MENYTEPVKELERWVEEARLRGEPEPTAMCLSTVDERGWPDARMVLFKGMSQGGIRFFTNYGSTKARQLEALGVAHLTFFWPIAFQQLRVLGAIEKLSKEESKVYFQSRPRESQVGAWASQQSTPVAGRDQMEAEYQSVLERFEGQDPLPLPDFWGGYRLIPQEIEFWQGREGRFHDRVRYKRTEQGWQAQRLSP